MYIPPSFAENDLPTLHAFMERHSFATLVSSADGEPVASHVPLLLDRTVGPQGTLLGHVARANTQWRTAEGQRVLALFQGPHAYVSPTWYESANVVPTWNYMTVHAYGALRLVADRARLYQIVRRMVDFYEAGRPAPWRLESQEAGFSDRLLEAIVGFEIPLDRLEGKWKLSQNHPVDRREKVIRALSASSDSDARAIAAAMAATLARSETGKTDRG